MRSGVIIIISLLLTSACDAARPTHTEKGFRIPAENHEFVFPRDHGSHPEYRIEWWYITGHLRDEEQNRFGFQATFFRYALAAGDADENLIFGTNQLYMAHMALSDIGNSAFYHEERLNRDGWDAYASATDLELRNGNWMLKRTTGEAMHLKASIKSGISMDLNLIPAQPLVKFGDNGLSLKGAEVSACSWYLTFPRLTITGELIVNGAAKKVHGEAWMDHEISSSQLGRDQVGWDWLSVRTNDGQELMVYILRDREGRPDPYSTLAWIEADGTLHHYGPEAFDWSASGSWTSPETGASYPIDVLLRGKRPDGRPFEFEVKPLMRNQELVGKIGGISYWEGACDILEGDDTIGEAYMELTGYGESLESQLK